MDYVEIETPEVRKRVEDAEIGIKQVHEHTWTAENVGLTTREPEETFQERMIANGDSLSNHASSDNGEHGDDENYKETAQNKLSKDDKPGWVKGPISKMVQQCMERLRQK